MAQRADADRGVYDLEHNDPLGLLFDRGRLDGAEVAQIGELMQAMGAVRDAEQRISDASLRYMKLNRTDMRALHFLIVAANRGDLVTPGSLAAHLGISSASTTKLMDRLESTGHITRAPHPRDRRALTISITEETRHAATETIGRIQARRAIAAASLSAAEREVVTRFLRETARVLSESEVPER